MRSVEQLYELQLMDWDIQKLSEEMTDIRARLADDSARMNAWRRAAPLKAQIEKLAESRLQSDKSVQQLEHQIARIDSRLYSGAITNPRELEAHQEERQTLADRLSEEENGLLEYMVEIEDTQSAAEEAQSAFERIDAERRAEVAESEIRRRELEAQLPSLQQDRDSAAGEYPPPLIAMYEMVRRRRGGQGAAKVDLRGLCQACRIVIPTAHLQRVRTGQQTVQCPNCTRILIRE